ncbi:hypothetical protein FDP41_011846 [Naegleria fowleri]|uniref:Uncharacterized protein n=1 Tax=Naegleria fowleri TaxID=5763 RepID=A0A6A5C9F3_NAEFO|nr:uncharacterized protein FDP41_011846 [Naegleria fowleri]KAF0981985.1 hypothetical protein FDP41_011846 [Naegleria fowleri]CAG4714386.1 unnamed protein product [Naegleria fowleri]
MSVKASSFLFTICLISVVVFCCKYCQSGTVTTTNNTLKYFDELEKYGKDLRNYTNLSASLNNLPFEKEARSLIQSVLNKEESLWKEFASARTRLMISRKTIEDLRSELPKADDEHKLIKHLDYIVQEEIKVDDDDLSEMLTSAEESTRTSQDDIKELLQEQHQDLERYNEQYLKKVVMYEFGLESRNRTISTVASVLKDHSFKTAFEMCKAVAKELATELQISCKKFKKSASRSSKFT